MPPIIGGDKMTTSWKEGNKARQQLWQSHKAKSYISSEKTAKIAG
jgi:hypothetical protein